MAKDLHLQSSKVIVIKIKPDRICPNVNLVDKNNDKFERKLLNKNTTPRPINFDP